MARDPCAALTPTMCRLVSAYDAIRVGPPDRIDYLHSVFCQCPLPYRCSGRGRHVWERHQGRAFLRLEAGSAFDPRRDAYVELGLPYGEKPRLVLIHLTSEAVRTGSPVIDVKDSVTAFMRSIGLDTGGRALHHFKDQLNRLTAITARLSISDGEVTHNLAARFINEHDLWCSNDASQRVLWPSVVRLSPEFFQSLRRHAVPVDPRAIGALAHSALALDVYAWLAQRLWRVSAARPAFVPWASVKLQFGPHYRRMGDFRRKFTAVLTRVRLVYPAARLEVDEQRGLRLHQSPPPIAARLHPASHPTPQRRRLSCDLERFRVARAQGDLVQG